MVLISKFFVISSYYLYVQLLGEERSGELRRTPKCGRQCETKLLVVIKHGSTECWNWQLEVVVVVGGAVICGPSQHAFK